MFSLLIAFILSPVVSWCAACSDLSYDSFRSNESPSQKKFSTESGFPRACIRTIQTALQNPQAFCDLIQTNIFNQFTLPTPTTLSTNNWHASISQIIEQVSCVYIQTCALLMYEAYIVTHHHSPSFSSNLFLSIHSASLMSASPGYDAIQLLRESIRSTHILQCLNHPYTPSYLPSQTLLTKLNSSLNQTAPLHTPIQLLLGNVRNSEMSSLRAVAAMIPTHDPQALACRPKTSLPTPTTHHHPYRRYMNVPITQAPQHAQSLPTSPPKNQLTAKFRRPLPLPKKPSHILPSPMPAPSIPLLQKIPTNIAYNTCLHIALQGLLQPTEMCPQIRKLSPSSKTLGGVIHHLSYDFTKNRQNAIHFLLEAWIARHNTTFDAKIFHSIVSKYSPSMEEEPLHKHTQFLGDCLRIAFLTQTSMTKKLCDYEEKQDISELLTDVSQNERRSIHPDTIRAHFTKPRVGCSLLSLATLTSRFSQHSHCPPIANSISDETISKTPYLDRFLKSVSTHYTTTALSPYDPQGLAPSSTLPSYSKLQPKSTAC